LRRELEIRADDTAFTLAPRLSEIGADLLVETLKRLKQGMLEPVLQDDAMATQAPILKKEDGKIDFHRTAQEIYNRLRGFQPWPGAYTHFRGKNLKILAAQPILHPIQAGEMQAFPDKLLVGCGQNSSLELIQLQPEGKKPMTARDF